MTTDLAVVDASPEVRLSSQDLEMIRRQVNIPSGKRPPTDAELTDFGRACMAQRLNPFDRHIYLAHIGGRWTYFIGVHGRLVIAFRTGLVTGMEGPLYCHKRDGIERGQPPDWCELWDETTPPHAAKFVIHRKGMDHHPSGVARWQEYGRDTNVWREKPTLMLGYKAITRALNLVFPDVMPPDQSNGDADVDESAGYVRAEDTPPPFVAPTEGQLEEIRELLVQVGLDGADNRARRVDYLSRTLGHPIGSASDIGRDDMNVVIEALRAVVEREPEEEPFDDRHERP